MSPGQRYANWNSPPATPTAAAAAAAASSSSCQPPERSSARDPLFDCDGYDDSHGGASLVSPFSDLQTLGSRFSGLGLFDSNAHQQHQHLQPPLPPLWNSGRYNQDFVDLQSINGGGYRVSPISQQETERQRINQLQRLSYQNDCVNGSYGFDGSRHSSTLMGQYRVHNNGFQSGDLGEVPYLPRNSILDQMSSGTSNGSMFGNHIVGRRNNKYVPAYDSNFMPIPAYQSVMMESPSSRECYNNYNRLRNDIEHGSSDSIDRIFNCVVFHICELMVDPSGHHVVQKLIEKCTDEHITRILVMVTKDQFQLVNICNDSHGTRAIQALLRRLRSQDQISCFMDALSPVVLPLTKNTNGGHVIQSCLSQFSLLNNMLLLEVVAQHCFQIAIDQHGCCLLQHCITYSDGELRQRLIREIIANALRLANHCYGNYLVQYVMELKDPRATADLLRQLGGNYTYLARDKYGSHVVEKLLSNLREEDSRRIVCELLRDINMLIIDPYGNFVVQTAWVVSRGDIREALLRYIRENEQLMRCNRYGRKVLEKLNFL